MMIYKDVYDCVEKKEAKYQIEKKASEKKQYEELKLRRKEISKSMELAYKKWQCND